MLLALLPAAVLYVGLTVVLSSDGHVAGIPAGGAGSHLATSLAALSPLPLLAAGWLLGLPFPAAAAEAALWTLANPVVAALAVVAAYSFGEDRLPPLYAAAVGLVATCLGRAALAEAAPWAADPVTPASAAGGTVAFVAVAALADLVERLCRRRRSAGPRDGRPPARGIGRAACRPHAGGGGD